ncbi:MAG: hypothetical protein APR54_11695 [Candidatus Cloacimonas sp. SDB]|nr:MAG: hypothetical protein APR54_11695 [Candidatus Cloacimonas sp. SDB]
MKIIKENINLIYILFGLLYFIFKVIWYICDFVYFRGVILGLIATVLTTFIGILSFRKYKKAVKPVTHCLAVLIPLIIIPLTPIIMIHNLGSEIFQIEKIAILIIFEGLAITQVILGIVIIKRRKL